MGGGNGRFAEVLREWADDEVEADAGGVVVVVDVEVVLLCLENEADGGSNPGEPARPREPLEKVADLLR